MGSIIWYKCRRHKPRHRPNRRRLAHDRVLGEHTVSGERAICLGWNNGSAWGVYMPQQQPNGQLGAVLVDTAGVSHAMFVGGEGPTGPGATMR